MKEENTNIEVYYLDKNVDPCVKFKAPVIKFNLWKFHFNEFDIVHTTGIRPDFIAFLYHRRIKYHISTIHNFVFIDLAYTYNKLLSLIFGNIWLLLWKRADKLVCVSETMKDYYLKWYIPSRLEIIHNGISVNNDSLILDLDIIERIERFKSRGLRIIGTASVLTKRKGIEQVLHLIASEPNYAFVIIGDGKEYFRLKKLVNQLNISERCLFCGFISQAAKYFSQFDIFLMPSRSEGFGLVLLEAIQKNVPIICSDIEVFKELFSSKEVTFFISDNKQSLINALRTVEETGSQKIIAAQKRVKKEYTNTVMSSRYNRLYQSSMV